MRSAPTPTHAPGENSGRSPAFLLHAVRAFLFITLSSAWITCLLVDRNFRSVAAAIAAWLGFALIAVGILAAVASVVSLAALAFSLAARKGQAAQPDYVAVQLPDESAA
jgi:hypothetical protein